MQLNKHVKIALFFYEEIFLMVFFMLFYFNLFQNWGNVFSICLVLQIKVFCINLQKAIFLCEKKI